MSEKKTGKRQPREKQVVIKNDEAIDQVPEKLKVYVSEDIWSTWSPIRRESFKQIIKNPNGFLQKPATGRPPKVRSLHAPGRRPVH